MENFLKIMVRQAAHYDQQGEYEIADAISRSLEAMQVRNVRVAANPFTDLPGLLQNTGTAINNYWDAGGGLPGGFMQGAANPANLLQSMKDSLNWLQQRIVDPTAQIKAIDRQFCTQVLTLAIQTLNSYNPAAGKAAELAAAPKLPPMSLAPHASSSRNNIRVANDDPRIADEIKAALGSLAYLENDRYFPGGKSVYDSIARGLNSMYSVMSGSTTAQQAATSLSTPPATANPAPATTATSPATAPTNPAATAPTTSTAPAATGPATLNPAAWAKYNGQYYNRENHMAQYLNLASSQNWDYAQLAQHLHQHEADMGFIQEVLGRYNQQWQQKIDQANQLRQYVDNTQEMNGADGATGGQQSTGYGAPSADPSVGGTVMGGPQGGFYPAMGNQVYPAAGQAAPPTGAYSGAGSGYGYNNWGTPPAAPPPPAPYNPNQRRP